MQGLKVYTRSGEALTTEEIEFAHRVANQHKEMSFGVITMTDPTSGVIVEYHADKKIAYTSGDVGAYFGYNASVDMRCWCRGIVLAETAGGSVSLVITTISDSERTYAITKNGTVVLSGTGTTSLSGTLINGVFTYNNWPAGGAIDAGEWNGGLYNGSYTITGGVVSSSNVVITPWPLRSTLQAEANSEANQRSAVFLTDGTELASAPRTDTYDASTGITTMHNMFLSYLWHGGDSIWLADVVSYQDYVAKTGDLTFIVPDDACYKKVNVPAYPDPNASLSVLAQWSSDWNAAQLIALTREHARRKKCSDGQLAYLRNGFLSPEFEYFIKTKHPVSTLVRRDIQMEIVSVTETIIFDSGVGDDGFTQTTITQNDVVIRYKNKDTNEYYQHDFTGTVKKEVVMCLGTGGGYAQTYERLTFSNYPLVSGESGNTYPEQNAFGFNSLIDISARMAGGVWHDSKTGILMSLVNGVDVHSPWLPTNRGNVTPSGVIIASTLASSYSPPLLPSSYDATFTHPQFLLDYISASKPIEKEVDIDGNKVPVTPSTDWLSSRLAHNEVVTIVPLSFVNADGEDRGMYPYSRTDEVPAQVKLAGFAKVKYNYFTGSFTFESWTEFTTEGNIKHDGNATYDAETNPTSVNVGGTTYTLQPKYFDYNTAWATPNCVCIAGKTPWTDTKAAYKTQKANIADVPPEGYTPTAEELLYQEVRKAINR